MDYCTLVFPADLAGTQGIETAAQAVEWLFPGVPVTVSMLEAKRWQFYDESAYIYGADGKVIGRVGAGGNAGTVCVSLTGAGCTLVDDWWCTVVQARRLQARVSRADFAFDDFEGAIFGDIRDVNEWAKSGRFNARTGRPCDTNFFDDHGKGKGCTVYVGSRGAKQGCFYEKGKQLGDKESPWVRAEVRMWGNECVIPLEALAKPLAYIRGAYELLATLLPADAEPAKPERTARTVQATAVAAVRFLRDQCGPTLDLLVRSIGPDVWHLFNEQVFRTQMPKRFKGIARDMNHLRSIVREQLGYARTLPETVVAV